MEFRDCLEFLLVDESTRYKLLLSLEILQGVNDVSLGIVSSGI